jgi:anti-sigma-K factor RskA
MQSDEELEDLIIGYSLNNLTAEQRAQAERLLESDPRARDLLAEWQHTAGNLALLVEPQPLPAGSLNRLRQKAGVPLILERPTGQSAPPPIPLQTRQKSNNRQTWAAIAAAVVFFLISAVLLVLLLNANGQLNRNQEIVALLASPDLSVVELQANESNVSGTVRYYADTRRDKAYLVVQNLNALPGDKEYEAWFLTPDSKAQKAALLGSGGSNYAVFELDTKGNLDQFSVVAITIERKGGVDQPTQNPILVAEVA